MLSLPGAPFALTYRELWLPPGIKDWGGPLPPSVEGGHELAFTGARHGTTADGVHGIAGVATSNINLGAIHNNENILYIKIRFKLDQPFSIAAATDQYLFGKYDGPNDYLIGWLEADDGMFHMAHAEGGAVEAIVSAEDTWDTQWHTILVSLHNANGQRLIVDGGAVVTQVGNTTPITLTADFVLLCRDDGVSIEGLLGVEVDVVMGIAALTGADEADLYAGIPPAAATEEYLLDEGRGVTAYNRGSSGAGADGTLDTSCTWAFGQVQQPVISLDGINDHADSPAGIDISGALTVVWVGKMKSTYSVLGSFKYLLQLFVDANNEIRIYYGPVGGINIAWYLEGAGVVRGVNYSSIHSIDDYIIFIGVASPSEAKLFVNGLRIGTSAGANVSAAAAIARLGVGGAYDISKPLFVALIDGAFTNQQALAYSRYLKNIFNLPITI